MTKLELKGTDLVKLGGENLFFTGDTHFGHANIIRFCNRPFRDVQEMDETLIRNWNETVPEDGLVFHLGDFCNGGSKEWNGILDRLHGRIVLILGNHDLKNMRQGYMKRFEHVSQQMSINVDGQSIFLNHNPFLCYGGAYNNTWQLFGHVHSGPTAKTGLDHPRLNLLFPMQYDVGVDNNDYRPVSFSEVKAIIEARKNKEREQNGCGAMPLGDNRNIISVAISPALEGNTGMST